MAEQRDDALLLRSIPYSDSSLILQCLTENHGRISVMARGARRAKSPFRASLMPLYKIQLRWKEPRTGSMGTLLEAQRITPLLPDSYILAGQELLAKAAILFPDGVDQGYAELLHAFYILSQQHESIGSIAATWSMLESSGLISDFEHCWHCSESIELNASMYWYQAHLLCHACANQHGSPVSSGFRKTVIFSLQQENIQFQTMYVQMWKKMVQDLFKLHKGSQN